MTTPKVTVRKGSFYWWVRLGHFSWPFRSWPEAMWHATGLTGQ